MKVHAAVIEAVDKIEMREIDLDEPKVGEVLVRLVATGLCHTDASLLHGILPVPLPLVAGHEGAGVVEAVGPGVTNVAVGDHVVCSIVIRCGNCYTCVRNQHPCEAALAVAFAGTMLDGTHRLRDNGEPVNHISCQSAFADHMVVPAAAAVRVDPEVPLEKVASLGCSIGTGLGAAINRAGVTPGSSVLVVGAGGVGLAAVMGARAVGASTVIAADILDNKLAKASQLGATDTVNSGRENLSDVINNLTAGRGVDYAIDAAGAAGTLQASFQATRAGGTCVAVGLMDPTMTTEIDTFSLLTEKTLTGSYAGSLSPHRDIPAYIELYRQGRLDLDALVEAEFPPDQIESGLRELEQGAFIRAFVRW